MSHFLILGGGTAGCYLASRILDENLLYTVTIIEQGSANFDDPNIRSASKIGKIMDNPEYIRTIQSEEGSVSMGSVLGGGSSVNGAYLVLPSNKYLNSLPKTGKTNWIDIKDKLLTLLPTEENKTGKFMETLNGNLENTDLTNDVFYRLLTERISSVSFLNRYKNTSRLNIISQKTVESIKRINNLLTVRINNGDIISSNYVIICCGASTPEILMKGNPNFIPSKVFNHMGVRLKLDKDISNTSGQIFFKGETGYTEQLLIYGRNLNIYNLNPDIGWDIKLASRGEMYYTGKQMSEKLKESFDNKVDKIRKALRKMNYSIINEEPSPTYHMTGGCQDIVNNFAVKDESNLFIADLSILPIIPDANTSFMALMIAEKFVQEYLV